MNGRIPINKLKLIQAERYWGYRSRLVSSEEEIHYFDILFIDR